MYNLMTYIVFGMCAYGNNPFGEQYDYYDLHASDEQEHLLNTSNQPRNTIDYVSVSSDDIFPRHTEYVSNYSTNVYPSTSSGISNWQTNPTGQGAYEYPSISSDIGTTSGYECSLDDMIRELPLIPGNILEEVSPEERSMLLNQIENHNDFTTIGHASGRELLLGHEILTAQEECLNHSEIMAMDDPCAHSMFTYNYSDQRVDDRQAVCVAGPSQSYSHHGIDNPNDNSFYVCQPDETTSYTDHAEHDNDTEERICDLELSLKSSDIRHKNVPCSIKLFNLKKHKKLYSSILVSFWYVVYGQYHGSTCNKIRLYIRYDDNELITSMFEMQSKQYLLSQISESIVNIVVNYVGPNMINKGKTLSKNELFDNKEKRMSTGYSIKYLEKEMLNKVISSDEHLELYFNELRNAEQPIHADCNDIGAQMQCYMDSADVLFRIMSIHSSKFSKVKCMTLYNDYANQLSIFLNHNLDVKLLLFPEIISLRVSISEFKKIEFENMLSRMFIGYYAMCKFEAFINYLGRDLLKKGLNSRDVLFFRLYVSEFYLSYIYMSCFEMNVFYIMEYICMNRLSFLCFISHTSNDHIYTNEGNLMEFLLYNLTYVDKVCVFKELMQIIQEESLKTHKDELNISELIKNIKYHIIGDVDKCNTVVNGFFASLDCLRTTGIEIGDIIDSIVNNEHISLDGSVNYDVICKWTSMLRDVLIARQA